MSIMDLYKSMTVNYRIEEEDIITKAIDEGVVTDIMRYGVMNGTMRGVIKSPNEGLYYFNYSPNKELIVSPANDQTKQWEAGRLLSKCKLGCDLIKAKLEEEDEAEKADGETGEVPSVAHVIPEQQNIQAQQRIMTERHPGAATGTTPDLPGRGRQWHEEQPAQKSTGFWNKNMLLQGLGKSLQKNAAMRNRAPTKQEEQFMLEVLGRTPGEISSGEVFMNPTQKVMFARWAGKSLKTKIDNLSGWLEKKR